MLHDTKIREQHKVTLVIRHQIWASLNTSDLLPILETPRTCQNKTAIGITNSKVQTKPERINTVIEKTQNTGAMIRAPDSPTAPSVISSVDIDRMTCIEDNTSDMLANPNIRGAEIRCKYVYTDQ